MMTEYGEFAISMARIAGSFLKNRFGANHEIDYKGEIDIVTEADRMSEKDIDNGNQQEIPRSQYTGGGVDGDKERLPIQMDN